MSLASKRCWGRTREWAWRIPSSTVACSLARIFFFTELRFPQNRLRSVVFEVLECEFLFRHSVPARALVGEIAARHLLGLLLRVHDTGLALSAQFRQVDRCAVVQEKPPKRIEQKQLERLRNHDAARFLVDGELGQAGLVGEENFGHDVLGCHDVGRELDLLRKSEGSRRAISWIEDGEFFWEFRASGVKEGNEFGNVRIHVEGSFFSFFFLFLLSIFFFREH